MGFIRFMDYNPAVFLLVLARAGALVLTAPVFGAGETPLRIRLGFAFALAVVIAPLVKEGASTDAALFVAAIACEAVAGAAIGFAMRLVFAGVEYAGEVASAQMSLGLGAVYDPASAPMRSPVGRFFTVFAVLVFLSMNGHLMVIGAFARSFEAAPAGAFVLAPAFMERMIVFSKEVFIIAVKLSAPIIAVSLFVNAACVIVARSVPGLDILTVMFTAAIAAGLLMIMLSISSFEAALAMIFDRMFDGITVLATGGGHAV
ncbi:MAG: flagellar biosynthetic protein FliR [Deltaproteobacteria bacterium]|nr:flagellar biosynthetic protein FliR [Deltaproteobacteria bacterium]